MADQSFDGIARKFEHNIYGTSKGQLRHTLLCDRLDFLREMSSPLHILDLGGGSGEMAAFCLELGHRVDMVDASADILEIAKQKLQHQSDITFIHSPLQSFHAELKYDLVICHAVLEWLDEPLTQLPTILRHVKSDGLVSLSVFNQDAKLFANALYGNFDYIEKGMQVKNQVRLNPKHPLQPQALLDAVKNQGFDVQSMAGIRCFHDYMKEPIDDEQALQALFALERKYGQQHPYCWLGKYFHVIAKPQ